MIRAWKEGTGGLTVYDGYGQSETTVLVANYRSMPVRPGSMGKPVPGWTVDVLDEYGRAGARRRRSAAIAVQVTDPRPVGLFVGYEGDDEANAKAFRDGWYYTGDKAWRDGDGYLWFEGRDDDVITSSAYRIGPFEVESALVEHPAVVEAAVVGKDDPQRTQIVTAFVILAAGYEPAATSSSPSCRTHARGADRALQVPAGDPLRRRAAQDGQRQDPPHRAARVAAFAGLTGGTRDRNPRAPSQTSPRPTREAVAPAR